MSPEGKGSIRSEADISRLLNGLRFDLKEVTNNIPLIVHLAGGRFQQAGYKILPIREPSEGNEYQVLLSEKWAKGERSLVQFSSGSWQLNIKEDETTDFYVTRDGEGATILQGKLPLEIFTSVLKTFYRKGGLSEKSLIKPEPLLLEIGLRESEKKGAIKTSSGVNCSLEIDKDKVLLIKRAYLV